ncbi:MAG TPA: hypothetical protein VNZ49_12685 [Bacteroidia bacterium]|jgi:hypothetical protein|nr:hypothetical protein [Bacteroidia bacterium]
MRRIVYTVILFFNLCVFYAQENNEVVEREFIETRDIKFRESLLAIRGGANVPNVLSSPGFRNSFKGIYEVNAAFTIRIASGFNLGVGLKNALISTQERIQNLDTRMQLYTGYLKFAYNHFHTQRTYSSLGFNIGYNSSFFTNVQPIISPVISKDYSSIVFEPEYSINFAVEESFSIGMFVSYTFMPTPFNAVNIAMQDYTPLSTAGANKAVGILNVGFCFYVGMGKRFKPNLPN